VKVYLARDYIVASDISKESKFDNDKHSIDMYVYKILQNDYHWWSKLEWTPFGRSIWNLCASKAKEFGIEIAILTSPMTRLGNGNGSKIGKMLWVFENLGSEIKVVLDGNKGKFSKNNFLVDDTPGNIKAFKDSYLVVPSGEGAVWTVTLKRKLDEWNKDR